MPTFVLRPNIKKAYIVSINKILSAVAIIIIIIVVFNVFIGSVGLLDIFDFLGINISTKIFWGYLIFAIAVVTLIVLVLNYVTLSNARFEFLDDKLVIYTPALLVMLSNEEIPYDNIISASYKQSFFDKMLNSGTIIISLRGMTMQSTNLGLIDNAVIYASNINNLLDNYRAIRQSQIEGEVKVDRILEREVY